MPQDSEYTALREEILEWQRRRIVVTMNTATVVAAILGLVTSLARSFMWTALSATLLALLVSSMLFSWYAADAASRLGAYLLVFHESKWEKVGGELRRSRVQNVNSVLAVIYLTLGIAACVVPAAATTDRSQPWYGWLLLIGAGVIFLGMTAILALWSYLNRGAYEEKARQIKATAARGSS